jgi:MFS family permease
LSGSFLAIWIGDRFGSKWPIVLGIGLNVAAAAALNYGTNPIHFVILNVIWIGSYYFIVPYLLGLMARLDDLGRWAVAVDAIVILNVIWIGSYYFIVPYLLGLMARLDDLGRWAVAVDAIWWLGDAAGPPVAGMIVERSGFELLAAFPLCTGVIGITIFMRVLRRFGSNRKASVGGDDPQGV